MTKPPFDDIRVRQAFLQAIDRQAIKETLCPGSLAQLAVSPLPPGYFGHISVAIPEYDPEKAKKLLAEAGHPNGFTIKDYFISKSFFFPKMMTLVQEQLKKVGINVELQLVEHPTYHEHIRKNLNPSYSHAIPSGCRRPLTPSMGSSPCISITIIQRC